MLYLVLFSVFTLPFYRMVEVSLFGVGVSLIDLIVVACAPIILSRWHAVSRSAIISIAALFALLAFVSISILLNGATPAGIVYLSSLILKVVFCYTIMVSMRTDIERRKLIRILTYGSALAGTSAILQQVLSVASTGSMISVAGTYGARNEMLSLIVPASLFSVYLLVTSRKKLLPLVVLIIQVVAIVISRGRLGLLTFIVIGATLYVLLNRVSFKSLSKILAFSVAVAVSAFFMMPDAYEQIIFRYTDSIIAEIDDSRGSAFIRGVITRGVLDVWLENPFFGIGPGAFLHESYNYIGLSELGPVQPHSTYLGLLAEVGVFGFLCFVIFVTVVVRVHRKAWLIGRDHRQLMIVVALATSSELILLIGFDGFLRYPLWMLIGLSLSYQYKRRADSIPQYNSAMTKV